MVNTPLGDRSEQGQAGESGESEPAGAHRARGPTAWSDRIAAGPRNAHAA